MFKFLKRWLQNDILYSIAGNENMGVRNVISYFQHIKNNAKYIITDKIYLQLYV